MKFSEMPYSRPDAEQLKSKVAELTERLKAAKTYEEAKAVFLENEELGSHVNTLAQLVMIRHSIDTRDAFYDEEQKWWNGIGPELQEYAQGWMAAMLASPFRPQFAAEYGELMFTNGDMALKTFKPEIIPQLQAENDEADAYEKLLASAQIPFEGGVYTLSQLTPFKTDADDARRLAAWKAEGQWYKDNQEALDAHYDKLVHLRDEMG
ncbi:MAG: M3 family oligoendopeptidase, partial [Firmicutes bacterium]|nr:M3 family oligoendopeptidase [Bacillota bacterium]